MIVAAFMVLCVTPRELTEDKPRTRCWSAFVGYPQLVTHVYVHGAEGLENQDNPGGQWAHSGLLLRVHALGVDQ